MAEGIKSSVKNVGTSGGGGSGTVTQVGLVLPSDVFDVTVSPITTMGDLTAVFQDQSANNVFAGPTSGVPSTPSFRALVSTDIPNLPASIITSGVFAIARGGTNSGTALNNNCIMQSSGGAIVEAAAITAARALISDANGIPTESVVTSTELALLSGKTSIGTIIGSTGAADNSIIRADGTGGVTVQAGTTFILDDNSRATVNIGDTATGATYGLRVTATLTGLASTTTAIDRYDITTGGSGSGAFVLGNWTRLLSGYTGNGMTAGHWVINSVAGTGTDLNGGSGNFGYRSSGFAGTTGYNVAFYGDIAGAGARNFGAWMDIEAGGSSGINVGFGTSVNPGSGTLKAVGFYAKMTSSVGQVPNTSACAVFDNAASGLPSLVLQTGGTADFIVRSGGHLNTNQTASATLLGTVVAKLAIYNTSDTIVGYLPLYDSIT